jgi:hypothetical protein
MGMQTQPVRGPPNGVGHRHHLLMGQGRKGSSNTVEAEGGRRVTKCAQMVASASSSLFSSSTRLKSSGVELSDAAGRLALSQCLKQSGEQGSGPTSASSASAPWRHGQVAGGGWDQERKGEGDISEQSSASKAHGGLGTHHNWRGRVCVVAAVVHKAPAAKQLLVGIRHLRDPKPPLARPALGVAVAVAVAPWGATLGWGKRPSLCAAYGVGESHTQPAPAKWACRECPRPVPGQAPGAAPLEKGRSSRASA